MLNIVHLSSIICSVAEQVIEECWTMLNMVSERKKHSVLWKSSYPKGMHSRKKGTKE